ncbi:uncharacterized protein PgNI_08719 [Pyricularia grisea]|uniref:Uncharacterized protein n=1 Tax=Pyricularia grisea TaxID=148305 RepID=A0A6P8AWI3_PYRGI|nr:uncharacterized protein PgNI_08719 [Pyricularia grisea]TLD06534.1 hypothetical protein PgNI_08719 [Pyricularia grisea]
MPHPSTVGPPPPAFALLGQAEQDWGKGRGHVARACNVDQDTISDVYPCTPLQEGLMSLASKDKGDYIMEGTIELASDICMVRFRAAWEAMAEGLEVLRTRIVYPAATNNQSIIDRLYNPHLG